MKPVYRSRAALFAAVFVASALLVAILIFLRVGGDPAAPAVIGPSYSGHESLERAGAFNWPQELVAAVDQADTYETRASFVGSHLAAMAAAGPVSDPSVVATYVDAMPVQLMGETAPDPFSGGELERMVLSEFPESLPELEQLRTRLTALVHAWGRSAPEDYFSRLSSEGWVTDELVLKALNEVRGEGTGNAASSGSVPPAAELWHTWYESSHAAELVGEGVINVYPFSEEGIPSFDMSRRINAIIGKINWQGRGMKSPHALSDKSGAKRSVWIAEVLLYIRENSETGAVIPVMVQFWFDEEAGVWIPERLATTSVDRAKEVQLRLFL